MYSLAILSLFASLSYISCYDLLTYLGRKAIFVFYIWILSPFYTLFMVGYFFCHFLGLLTYGQVDALSRKGPGVVYLGTSYLDFARYFLSTNAYEN